MGITPAMIMGLAGAGLGGAGLAGLFGGPGKVQLPPQQSWPIGPAFGQGAGAISDLGQYNIGGQFLPDVTNIGRQFLNNPYASGYQQGGQLWGGLGQLNALQGLGYAGNIGGTVAPQIGAAGQILQTGFDPQQALYNRTAQQVAEQSRAGVSAAGLGATPWGAGVTGQNMSDFNINWNAAQLGRQTEAAKAAQGLYAGAGGAGINAFNLGNTATLAGVNASSLPWGIQNAILGAQLGGLGGVNQFAQGAAAIPQQQAGDWLSYMQAVNQANSIANQQGQLGLSQQQQGFNQQQAWMRQLGGGFGMMFPPGGGGFPQTFQNWGGGFPGGGPANYNMTGLPWGQ